MRVMPHPPRQQHRLCETGSGIDVGRGEETALQKLVDDPPQQRAQQALLPGTEPTAALLDGGTGKGHVPSLLPHVDLGDGEYRGRQLLICKDPPIEAVWDVLPHQNGGPEGRRTLRRKARKGTGQSWPIPGTGHERNLGAPLQLQKHQTVPDFFAHLMELIAVGGGISIHLRQPVAPEALYEQGLQP